MFTIKVVENGRTFTLHREHFFHITVFEIIKQKLLRHVYISYEVYFLNCFPFTQKDDVFV
jgi:hypothetical protein